MQPNYSRLEVKVAARKENVAIFRRVLGLESIPKEKQYWTLCNLQDPNCEGSEIIQMGALGLLKKNQFHGVDRDEDIIQKNKEWNPDAYWYHGEWIDVIRDCLNFNPALVYLDTTTFADCDISADIIISTMLLCPIDTLLLVNSILSGPYRRKFDSQTLINKVIKGVPSLELEKWTKEIKMYEYNATGKTNMITYVFYKEKNEECKK